MTENLPNPENVGSPASAGSPSFYPFRFTHEDALKLLAAAKRAAASRTRKIDGASIVYLGDMNRLKEAIAKMDNEKDQR